MAASQQNRELIRLFREEKRFHTQYKEGLRALLEPYGLSILEAEILFAVVNDAETNTVTRLCADIGKTKGVVSRGCDHLCGLNYLRAEADANDRRVVHFRTARASRSLIPVLAKYLEIMEYVRERRRAHSGDELFFLGRVERKKGQLYPIIEEEPFSEGFPFLPFVAYDEFLTTFAETCLGGEAAAACVSVFSRAALKQNGVPDEGISGSFPGADGVYTLNYVPITGDSGSLSVTRDAPPPSPKRRSSR